MLVGLREGVEGITHSESRRFRRASLRVLVSQMNSERQLGAHLVIELAPATDALRLVEVDDPVSDNSLVLRASQSIGVHREGVEQRTIPISHHAGFSKILPVTSTSGASPMQILCQFLVAEGTMFNFAEYARVP